MSPIQSLRYVPGPIKKEKKKKIKQKSKYKKNYIIQYKQLYNTIQTLHDELGYLTIRLEA